MEVAGQWRREWAGTAEYGKVTEGGVTRRVARAMEVLHASAPGARVRVMRAAYHSTSGSGAPTSSFMLHSSRRVISSGFNILESPTYPSKPLEISSTPFESSPESHIETENYKVTEPDDMDISEPSKWRGTTSGNSIRMPSEESSSTDNASIIDLDSRLNHKGLYRKYSYDSENSDVHSLKRNSARSSPLLDAPVTLSTLKYKSLLNNSSEWNNRRKSYSFEDTSPLNEIMEQKNDTLAMDSSTDSGICKSSEIVNDYPEDFVGREKRFNINRTGSADNWQFQNKPSTFYKGSKMKSYKEHDIVIEDPSENNVALQSSGKLTITVPITIEGTDDDKHNRLNANDDNDRKVKKVEFCKTELHFAAESGRVNIIATDEKPPPSYDFRKRRSAFVPINDKFEKPITLFGEKSDVSEKLKPDEFGVKDFSEQIEFDENTAATKSILKNKIPKPKPYLLGENMAFGGSQNVKQSCDSSVSSGVSLINKELETQRIYHGKESVHNFSNEQDKGFTDSLRTSNKGPSRNPSSNVEIKKPNNDSFFSPVEPKSTTDSIRNKMNVFQMSPVPKPKTRQLRDSDLTFFGIDKTSIAKNYIQHVEQKTARPYSDFANNAFESVRLIKQISSSAQNSEAESDDLPEYQNIPLKTNFAPVPIPRSRVKYKKPGEEVAVLKPIIEQQYDASKVTHESRRSRSRKQDEFVTITSRSRSEPAKKHTHDLLRKYNRHGGVANRTTEGMDNCTKDTDDLRNDDYKNYSKDDAPLYANYDGRVNRKDTSTNGRPRMRDLVAIANCESNRTLNEKKKKVNKSVDKQTNSLEKRQSSLKKINRVPRTEKLSTPELYNTTHQIKDNHESQKVINSVNGSINHSRRNNISPQRPKRDHKLVNKVKNADLKESPFLKDEDTLKKHSQDSKDRNTKKSEYSNTSKSTEQNASTHYIQSKEPRPVNRDIDEKGTNTRRTSRRSEYVIKYDDKNGTVSSISKVRAGNSTSRQKHASKERNKENSKEKKTKSKHFEKSALLQLPEHRIVNGRKENKTWNTKINLQRSCQLL